MGEDSKWQKQTSQNNNKHLIMCELYIDYNYRSGI